MNPEPEDTACRRSMADQKIPLTLLQVDPKSYLAGYSFETSKGRYATFFWQNDTAGLGLDKDYHDYNTHADPLPSYQASDNPVPGGIYSSTFYKDDPTWKPIGQNTLVAANAKKHSPLAAISWSNGLQAAVYYLDERNNICERLTIDGGQTWCSGALSQRLVPTRKNSSLAAVVSWEALENFEIHVYFQDEQNRVRDLRYSGEEKHWYEDYPENWKSLKGLSGASIVAANESTYGVKRWVYTQSAERWAQQYMYEKEGHKWDIMTSNHFAKYFNNNSTIRLGYSADPWYLRIFAHDGSKVVEHTWKRGKDCRWLDETILPMSTGTPKVLQNFIVLLWPLDLACTSSEIHLFSMEKGMLWDYIVGPAKGMAVSLVTQQRS